MSESFSSMNPLLSNSYRTGLEKYVKEFIIKYGSVVQGDHLLSDIDISKITTLCVDYISDRNDRNARLRRTITSLGSSNIENKISQIITCELKKDFDPKRSITDIIVEHRLKMFSPMLSSFGFNMHLITLPEFHVTAYNMHKLSQDFSVNGINAFVKNVQRPERIYSELDHTYTYYNHQTATGTGGEAAFNLAVGSHDVNTLSDSTEQDDIKARNN